MPVHNPEGSDPFDRRDDSEEQSRPRPSDHASVADEQGGVVDRCRRRAVDDSRAGERLHRGSGLCGQADRQAGGREQYPGAAVEEFHAHNIAQ